MTRLAKVVQHRGVTYHETGRDSLPVGAALRFQDIKGTMFIMKRLLLSLIPGRMLKERFEVVRSQCSTEAALSDPEPVEIEVFATGGAVQRAVGLPTSLDFARRGLGTKRRFAVTAPGAIVSLTLCSV